TREQFRIVNFWADGAGTYTPPGHWNFIAADLLYKSQYSEIRTARALCYLNLAMADAAVVCWDLKYFYMVPRPTQMDPEIKTATGIPNFPAFTSGHSTFSSSAATVIGYIFPGEAGKMWEMAVEASNSRIYGSIHYRFDCEVGLKSGKAIGDMVNAKAMADGCPNL
ncbi:MAG TPA: vanadium-dependent haloperoxidase, partial [Bacteroidia bacterium]|nr:vanadium-dependent haloperoxidase [Bacteroidia bacterium]